MDVVEMSAGHGDELHWGANVAMDFRPLAWNTGGDPLANILMEVRPEKLVSHEAYRGLDAGVGQSVELQGDGSAKLQRNEGARGSVGKLANNFRGAVRKFNFAKTPLLPGVGVYELEQIGILLLSGCQGNQVCGGRGCDGCHTSRRRCSPRRGELDFISMKV